MTDQPSRRTLMRGLIEDPGYDHTQDVGRILYLPDETRGMHQWLVDAVQAAEAGHPGNLRAQTQIVARPLELTLDVEAFNARAEQHVSGRSGS